MKPAPWRYARPASVAEAVGLLAAESNGARLLAGGQSLMPSLVRRLERLSLVIDINRIPGLQEIELLPTHIRMGALVRQEQALRSRVVQKEIPGVSAALAWVANPVVRQRGTVIGNLVMNSPGAELPAVALALGAKLVVRDVDREETVLAASIIGPRGRVPAKAMITHVIWPRCRARVGFYEVARREGHAPVVSCMVMLSADECRVALSGVCVTGLSCPTMARLIARQFPNIPEVKDLASALRDDLTGPVHEDSYSSAQYRLDVAPVVSQRATRLMVLQEQAA
jgi:CO/xanthine dehydrogenase FAD-binding subunit